MLFLIDHLDTGGAPVVVRDLIKGMHQAGVQVTLVVLSERVSHKLPEGVELVTLPLVMNTRAERRQRYARHAALLNDWLEQYSTRFQLVVAHLHHTHQVVSRSHLASQAWYCLHSDPVMDFLGNRRGVGRWNKRRKVRALYNRRKVVTVSLGMLKRLTTHFNVVPSKGVAIYNPLDGKRIAVMSQQSAVDAPIDYVLFVGRVTSRPKRVDRLLAAYQESGLEIPLLLIGGGDLSEVSSLINSMGLTDKVWVLGARDNPYAYMSQARALVLSSDYEGFPLVLLEALACGTPVVSVDCPTGPSELLTGELRDFLVPMDDIQAFANALQRVVDHPPAVPMDIAERYGLESVVARYLALAEPHSEQR